MEKSSPLSLKEKTWKINEKSSSGSLVPPLCFWICLKDRRKEKQLYNPVTSVVSHQRNQPKVG